MYVQELIDKLMKVEDKNKIVVISNVLHSVWDAVPIKKIIDSEGPVYLIAGGK